jgi:hypothetical protein
MAPATCLAPRAGFSIALPQVRAPQDAQLTPAVEPLGETDPLQPTGRALRDLVQEHDPARHLELGPMLGRKGLDHDPL